MSSKIRVIWRSAQIDKTFTMTLEEDKLPPAPVVLYWARALHGEYRSEFSSVSVFSNNALLFGQGIATL